MPTCKCIQCLNCFNVNIMFSCNHDYIAQMILMVKKCSFMVMITWQPLH